MTLSAKQRIWGWYAFDWASQPFHTLILTFIFGPYFVVVVGDPVRAQSAWGVAMTAAGLVTAVAAPVVGALADRSGRLVRWVAMLSVVYLGAVASLWCAVPGAAVIWPVLGALALGLITVELATSVTNAFLPDLAPRDATGRVSGNGFAIGYLGGLIALILMLAFFAQGPEGRTLLGLAPAFGLDPATQEGTRFVGPFSALWYLLFMIPFFVLVRDPIRQGTTERGTIQAELWRTLRHAATRRSLGMYLLSSMLYRDALVALYTFGGVYAAGVLGWPVTKVGVFGILGAASAMLACWLGGRADGRHGPKPVIVAMILVLIAVSAVVVGLDRDSLFGLVLPSGASDAVMFLCGALIGGAGGVLQSSSRTLMVRHTDPDRPSESFGLYALSGKATAFLAPFLVATVTTATQDQRIGIAPLIGLFLLALTLLGWVEKDGDI